MAKKAKTTTPLRQVRECSGLSQKEFASLVGINLHLYHSLELGRASLTEENVYRIFDHTGAAPSTLDHRRNAIARAADGNPVWSKNSCGFPVVEFKQSTQAFTFEDFSG